MSQTQTQRSLPKAESKILNTLCCIGYVSEVGECKVTESKNYIRANFKLTGLRGSRGAYPALNLRPEWFAADYKSDKATRQSYPFQQVMGLDKKMGALEGLIGKKFLGDFLSDLDSRGEITPDTLRDAFVAHFKREDVAGNRVGYILQQKSDKTDEINEETGKNIYILTGNYEVKEWFDANDDKVIKKMIARATKSRETEQDEDNPKPKFVIGFEVD